MGQTSPWNTPHMPSPAFQDLRNDVPGTVSLILVLWFNDMNMRLQTMRAAYDGSCEWLFKSEEYMTWRDPSQSDIHKGFLWIRGKPGSGKSTLIKAAYVHGVETFKEDVVISSSAQAACHYMDLSRACIARCSANFRKSTRSCRSHYGIPDRFQPEATQLGIKHAWRLCCVERYLNYDQSALHATLRAGRMSSCRCTRRH